MSICLLNKMRINIFKKRERELSELLLSVQADKRSCEDTGRRRLSTSPRERQRERERERMHP